MVLVPVKYDEGERTAGHFCRGEIAAARGVLDHITDTVVSHKVCFDQLYVFAFLIVLRFSHLFPWYFPSGLAQAFPHSWSRLLAMPLPSKRVETKEKSEGRRAPPSNCHNFRIVTAIYDRNHFKKDAHKRNWKGAGGGRRREDQEDTTPTPTHRHPHCTTLSKSTIERHNNFSCPKYPRMAPTKDKAGPGNGMGQGLRPPAGVW